MGNSYNTFLFNMKEVIREDINFIQSLENEVKEMDVNEEGKKSLLASIAYQKQQNEKRVDDFGRMVAKIKNEYQAR